MIEPPATAVASSDSADDLSALLTRSAEFYRALHAVLGDTLDVDSRRDLLTQGSCSVALEHGRCIAMLVDMDNVASAIVLLRAQFEAIARALWLHGVATDEWIERYFEAVKANPLKDPNLSKQVHEMLPALANSRHAPAARMLNTLKDAAWGPLNSYVHSGMQAIVHTHVEVPTGYAIQVLRNIEWTVRHGCHVDGDDDRQRRHRYGRRNAQLAHLDCLPPIPR